MTSTAQISRRQFQKAIEFGIVEAKRFAQDNPAASFDGVPRDWRGRLRKVGREATAATRVTFTDCPLTQAGLRSTCGFRTHAALMEFACAFDSHTKSVVGDARGLEIV